MMLDEKKAFQQISRNAVRRRTRSVLRSARSVVLFFKLKEKEEERSEVELTNVQDGRPTSDRRNHKIQQKSMLVADSGALR